MSAVKSLTEQRAGKLLTFLLYLEECKDGLGNIKKPAKEFECFNNYLIRVLKEQKLITVAGSNKNQKTIWSSTVKPNIHMARKVITAMDHLRDNSPSAKKEYFKKTPTVDNRSSETENKPPLGIIPEYLWIESRAKEISNAIERFIQSKQNIPYSWMEEAFRHQERLDELKKERHGQRSNQ